MKILVLLTCVLTLGLASVAVANVPDLGTSTADFTYHAGGGMQAVTLFVLPNGTGNTFANAALVDGSTADATVTLYVRNSVGGSIEGFPAEDMYLASPGLVVCYLGAIADGPTDAAGMTQWADPLFAGGNSESMVQVMISGNALTSSAGMDIHFNSADVSGDLDVNLADVGMLSADLGAGYAFRSDFIFNGVLNLADVGRLAASVGSVCP